MDTLFGFSNIKYLVGLVVIFIAPCVLIGLIRWLISSLIQRCEILADNLATRYVSKKALKEAIIKLGVISETNNSVVLNFSSKTDIEFAKRENYSLVRQIMKQLKWSNIFTKHTYSKLYFHPTFSERFKALDNSMAIIKEKSTGLLHFDVFFTILVYTFGVVAIIGAWLSVGYLKNGDWQYVYFVTAIIMHCCFVLLACFPLRYAQNPFIFDKKNVKVVIIYSLTITILSSIATFMGRLRYTGGEVKSYSVVLSQILYGIKILGYGFIFSFVLFGVFLSVGNFVIKRKSKRTAQMV